MGSVKRVLALVHHVDELKSEIDKLKTQGFKEEELNLIAQDTDRLEQFERDSEITAVEAGSFKDQFKSFITGESSVREGLKTLDLSEQELEEYTRDVARGSILVYVDIDV
ncbi:MAG TPA: general stress protein [Planococcus sp. (in: firmicutes)]|nr:general stress protein [Planococcus sp. (in: firmicutes)]